jgi:hypothetical protein
LRVLFVLFSHLGVSNVDLDGVVEERGGELLDFLGPGRGEEERGALGCGRAVREHVADLGLEAHVKHSICFVKDQVGHLGKERDNVHKHEKWLTSQKIGYTVRVSDKKYGGYGKEAGRGQCY